MTIAGTGTERAPVESEYRPQPAAAPSVTALIYELLDAHEDTARLATELSDGPTWRSHLEYLRRLQRIGRETLAHLSLDDAT
jgi:hypothetical protein